METMGTKLNHLDQMQSQSLGVTVLAVKMIASLDSDTLGCS